MHMPVFYRPEMSVSTRSFSPSSDKPRLVVDHWFQQGWIEPDDVRSFAPVLSGHLANAHSLEYVQGIFDGTIENGFGNTDPAVAESLRYTTGSFLAACDHVLQHGGIACSPTSGFHHAGTRRGGGFCTFNGLMVATLDMEAAGLKVGILDCDAHYGDGTEDIIECSGSSVVHRTFGAKFPCGQRAKGFLSWLSEATKAMQDCDIVLYQAGADPFVGDPLGGQLTLKEMQVRDTLVFDSFKNIVWNFAGGYVLDEDGSRTTLLQLHTNTLRAAQGSSCTK